MFLRYAVLFAVIATKSSSSKLTERELPKYGLNPPPEHKSCKDFFSEDCKQDCDLLKECDWPGFDESNLGDGFCDTNACYNSKICGFDGGDCCPGSCEDGDTYTCGDNGYDCKVESNGYDSCPSKLVRIEAFCLEGTLAIECNTTCEPFKDEFSLNFTLNDELGYYPDAEIKEDSCAFLTDSTYQEIDNYGSLILGFDEEETGFQFAYVPSSLWYSDDCRDYEVQVFKEIANRTVSTCYSASGGVDGTVGADIPLKGAAFEDCSTFERPTNSSFRWILEVVSVEP